MRDADTVEKHSIISHRHHTRMTAEKQIEYWFLRVMTRGFSSIEIFFCSIGLFRSSCFRLAAYTFAEHDKRMVGWPDSSFNGARRTLKIYPYIISRLVTYTLYLLYVVLVGPRKIHVTCNDTSRGIRYYRERERERGEVTFQLLFP